MYEQLGMTTALDWSAALRAAGMALAALILLRGQTKETKPLPQSA
jgi:hypothetical protein